MRTLIKGGTVVNEGRRYNASIIINDDTIEAIVPEGETACGNIHTTIDATGCFVLPGLIDTHVHFRDPGMTSKATIATESRAALAGGVTTYFDMPNNGAKSTISIEALEAKHAIAQRDSRANYAFYIGATNSNIDQLRAVDPTRVPAIKLFMGSSTGNMLVDNEEALDHVFASADRLPIVAHCEDTAIIQQNMARICQQYATDDPPIALHPEIRTRQACLKSTRMAIAMATKYGARLHVAHLTTADELQLFVPNSPTITAEAVVAHLLFCDRDYASHGSLIKCNPAIKTAADRDALRKALTSGLITTVGTDHAPHLLADKQGGCARAASGMPMVQFSLVAMMTLVDSGVLSIERLVELMAHNPSQLFSISKRGFLRPGYKADIAILEPTDTWTLQRSDVMSLCGWSPLEGHKFDWRVKATILNGHLAYIDGKIDDNTRGQAVRFSR